MPKKIAAELSDAQVQKLQDWLREQRAIALDRQRKDMSAEDFDSLTQGGQRPYEGVDGGSVTYMITYGSIGTVVQAKYALTDAVIDLTEYDMW